MNATISIPRRLIYLLIILAGLGGGGYLILDYRNSQPPDPVNDDPAQVVSFLLSPYFNRLGPDAQRRYTEAAMKRYVTMDDDQRTAVDAHLGKMRQTDGPAMRDQAMKVWKNFVVAEAQEYVQLPPDQRPDWLKSKIIQWKAMQPTRPPGAPGTGPPGDNRSKERREREEGPLTPERQEKVVRFFQAEVMPRSTARERALVMSLAKDAAPLMGPPPGR
jgi:hypothetical protein